MPSIHDSKKLGEKQKCIELVAKLYYSAEIIDEDFKDKCYCVKDDEQYQRYITIIKDTKELEKLNNYLVNKTNDILKSEEFHFKYLN